MKRNLVITADVIAAIALLSICWQSLAHTVFVIQKYGTFFNYVDLQLAIIGVWLCPRVFVSAWRSIKSEIAAT